MISSRYTMGDELPGDAEHPPRFAGHCDWRIPNVKEPQSVVSFEYYDPAVSPAFDNGCGPSWTVTTCSCTASDFRRSSPTYRYSPHSAWYVYFGNGFLSTSDKGYYMGARAVRGGF